MCGNVFCCVVWCVFVLIVVVVVVVCVHCVMLCPVVLWGVAVCCGCSVNVDCG